MADAPEQATPPALDEREYPSYVVTPDERERWDASKALAELIYDDLPDQAWAATRAIYGSDTPT